MADQRTPSTSAASLDAFVVDMLTGLSALGVRLDRHGGETAEQHEARVRALVEHLEQQHPTYVAQLAYAIAWARGDLD